MITLQVASAQATLCRRPHANIFTEKWYFLSLTIGFNKGLVSKSHTEQREGCYCMLSVYLQKLSAEWIKFLFGGDWKWTGMLVWREPNIITFWLWAWLSLNYVFFLKSQGTWITDQTWGHWHLSLLPVWACHNYLWPGSHKKKRVTLKFHNTVSNKKNG